MKKVLNIYKPISTTPYQLISKIKLNYPEYKDVKFAYAGRLDPMAHGVMLYLLGDETKNRDQYQKLNKTYQTKLVFGIKTDTYDPMGIITSIDKSVDIDIIRNVVFKYKNNLGGIKLQKYPPFSYPKIDGEPMYKLAREERLDPTKIPEKEVFIYKARFQNYQFTNINNIKSDIIEKINNVHGDFRQDEIINKWNSINSFKVVIVDAEFEVSSGTYIRGLAHEIGELSGYGAIAYDILRTRVGEFELKDSIRL